MKYPSGIFIDIFPLDNVPNNHKIRKVHNCFCTIIRKLLWSKVGAKAEKSPYLRALYRIISVIPKNFVFFLYNILKKASNKKSTELVRILTFPTPNNGYYGYYRKWYEELQDIEFEGYYFPGPKDYDDYLSFKFGNYMTLPPIEQRLGHASTKYTLIPKE
jgi:lipopolysaccharide cholinephosphotransferase